MIKKYRSPIQRLTVLLLFISFQSCYYDHPEEEVLSKTEVSFAADVQPIFDANCTVCHPALVPNPDLSEGNSYPTLINENYIIANDLDGSLLYQRLIGNPSVMPPTGSLPDSQITLIKNWIEQGALNN
ncbi:hypothetical protein Murru_2313 [Allomuricauda ruestringensis DSM 13258]|uniref:Cytochrome c domain-containing protein n=1 Tax=Allomuricauda ruestringensis (strain DSM 13258 / CIP 107369 / LMG 19739 / B1) TaxID=886377 RepID=G2PNH1_ALLRU|nr:cytochrome c [Allomuricauda ruestringensis]AEM71351.1 hypothetical protein Murru_2313 [Allomuricauda ruestringensis DSM 13258]